MLRDTFDFFNRVTEVRLSDNDHFLRYDIESLFTNTTNKKTMDYNFQFTLTGYNKNWETMKTSLTIKMTLSKMQWKDQS